MTTRLFRAAAVMVIALAALRAQTPVEPIAAIADAFRSHAIVAVGNVEFRGDEQCQAFLRALVRDPRIAAVANDIVVEFGSARHQDVIDRFVRGEEVPPEALRRVWQDTTQVEYEWDRPIYEEFFRTVRTVNASLPRGCVLADSKPSDPPRHSARRNQLGFQSTASPGAAGRAVRRTAVSRAPGVHDDVAACKVLVRGSHVHGDEGQAAGPGSTSVWCYLLVCAVERILRRSGWAEGDFGLRSRDH